MFNILIVDDEPLIKANIKIYLQELGHTFSVVGDASNGKEAIEILSAKKIHIILSDVIMPVMDGVELSDYVRQNHPTIPMVMLSNYDDFSYVRTTLRNGAVDYILKHTLNSKVLGQCLKKITESLTHDNPSTNNDIKENLHQMQNQFILRLIEKNDSDRLHLVDEMSLLELKLSPTNLIVCSIHIDDYVQFTNTVTLARKNAVETSVLSLINQTLGNDHQGHIIHLENEQYILILSFEHMHSAAKINARTSMILQQIRSILNKYLSLHVSISYSYICRDISDLSEAYAFVCKNMQQKFVMGKNRIYDNLALESGDEDLIWLDSDLKKNLTYELSYGEESKLLDYLKQVFDELKLKQVLYSQCHLLLYDLLSIINQTCALNKISPSNFYGEFELSSLNLGIFETLDDIEAFITSIYIKLFDKINKGIDKDYSTIVKNTITYIKNNYSSQFSLSEVAESLDVHSSYLSNLFKSEVGIGFSNFLTATRIEKAKEVMLKQDISKNSTDLKALAIQCGFNSYSYFSSTFKKIEGISPGQYMRNRK